MSLNLDKYKDSLVKAWREVMDSKSPTNWAIFGYEGQTFDLKLVSSGDGGIEEMNEDFNSGKIMYGLCRVRIEEKNTERIALINWQGEGAPLARKGTCANHVSTIKNFFKGVHVTINARTDEDVDPDVIIAAISKATSGTGVRLSSSTEPEAAPVGTTYKRVNPKEEINSQAKNDFWLKEEQEEERRKKEEQSKYHKFSRNEVQLLRKESQDYFNNEQDTHNSDVFTSPSPAASQNGSLKVNGDAFNFVATSPKSSSPAPSSESGRSSCGGLYVTSPSAASNEGRTSSTSPIPTVTNSFIASEKAAALKASLPRKSEKENLVRQRVKSFDGNNYNNNSFTTNGGGGNSINSNRNGTGKESESESLSVLRRKQLFESGGASSIKTPARKSVSDEIKQLQQESLKAAASAAAVKSPEPTHSINNRSPSPATQNQAATFDHQRTVVSPVRNKSPSPQPVQTQFPFQSKTATHQIKAYNLPFHIGGTVSGKLAEKINKNAENGVENGNHIETSQKSPPQEVKSIDPPEHFKDQSKVNVNRISPAAQQHQQQYGKSPSPIIQTTTKSPSPTPVATITPIHNETTSSPSPQPLDTGHSTPTKSIEITSEMGLCARALYDYQAADDTEITFDPGEIITHIERIDEGWWEGLGPQGMYGLFPANYVELLN